MDDLVNIAKEAFSFCTFSDYTIPVTLQINHHSVNALVDTGSWWSLIPNHIAEKIGLTPTETSINLHGIGKTQGFQAEPMLVTINDFPPTEIRFVIIPDAKLPCLIGLEILRKLNIVVNCADMSLTSTAPAFNAEDRIHQIEKTNLFTRTYGKNPS
eukprot:GHVO01021698.1.p1 GENE.GHVO01021698.1~~GHVO01021698.1.p1  ORF type:complete len:156 (-),score=12.35 GHVO01021698.1:345-812(-)